MSTDTALEESLRQALAAIGRDVPDQPPLSWSEYRRIPLDPVSDVPRPAPRSVGARARRARRPLLLASLGAAAAVVLLAVLWPVGTAGGPGSAAAAELRHAAAVVADQPFAQPGPGQALASHYDIGIRATELTPDGATRAAADFSGSVTEWTLPDGTGHEHISYGTPTPATGGPGSWTANANLPFQGDIPYSDQGPVLQEGPPVGAFEVAGLPTDPTALAHGLNQSSTGVKGLADGGTPGPDLAFVRVGMLLSAPQLGGSPALESALYQVLSTLPGITSLGPMTDHFGRRGVGFSIGSSVTLVVDPATGALLEMRGLPGALTTSAGAASGAAGTESPADGAIGTESLLWLDPTGTSIIGAGSVPPVVNGPG